jgi:hypothetical protein
VFVRTLIAAGGALPWMRCEVMRTRADSESDSGPASEPTEAGCPAFLTPTEEFFVQFGGQRTIAGWTMPELGEDARVQISGLVSIALAIDLAMLEADLDEHVTVVKTMMCVLGYRSTALFTGVPLRVLLDRAGIDRAAAKRVRFFGSDGFENNLRVQDIYDGSSDTFEPLIAFRIDSGRLPHALGFPFRLLLNDRYGLKNIKWLARIEVTADDLETGQYQENGYPDAGVIEPVPIVENLRVTQDVPAGPLELCGYALSGRGGIERVELSLDGGEFVAAQLSGLDGQLAAYPELGEAQQVVESARFGTRPRGVWVGWHATVELAPGAHSIALRALDSQGNRGEATTLTIDATA